MITEDATPVMALRRPATPLQYQAEQAAALHALLGLVLDGKAMLEEFEVVDDDGETPVAVVVHSEEDELAARGFRKFSADEYLRDVGEIWRMGFESPVYRY